MKTEKSTVSQLFTLKRILAGALKDYGGWTATAGSPFFWTAAVVAAISYRAWVSGSWANSTLEIIPSLLGFSLGTYALLFSLMSNRLKIALRAISNKRGISYLNEINSTFFYFISTQILVLLWAYLYQQTILYDFMALFGICDIESNPWFYVPALVGGYFGTVGLLYSVLLVIASSLSIYRLARIVDPSFD